jgi:hypothetical protein
MGPTFGIGRSLENKMKITLSESQSQVIIAALEAFTRFRINQPKIALEQIFPKDCHELGWNKMNELCRPIQEAFFPDHPGNGGPSICSERAGKEAHLAYEIQKTIQQYLALKKSGGWFGSATDFDGATLNPSGEPPPKIEGLEEMQYMDFCIPEECQDTVYVLIGNKSYKKFWEIVGDAVPDLPRGEYMEIVNKYVDDLGAMQRYYVRVHKPRKKVDDSEF